MSGEIAADNTIYQRELVKLAECIERDCAAVLKRGFDPPDQGACITLAAAIITVRNCDRRSRNPARERAVKRGRLFLAALGEVEKTDTIAEPITDVIDRLRTLLVGLGGHREPILFLAEHVQAAIGRANGGRFPVSPEKNGPLCAIVARLCDLAGRRASLATVSRVLCGERRRGAR